MKIHHALCASALVALSVSAQAAVSADEAKQLGTTLTEDEATYLILHIARLTGNLRKDPR